VTLSTSGLIPGIERLAKDDPGVKLAVSLNATTDEQRERIMPVNKRYPLARLLEALKRYSVATKRSRITFEYVMMDGFNDSNEDAKRLVKFLSHFPSKVNLIPLNPADGARPRPQNADTACGSSSTVLMGSDPITVQRFAQYLRNKHIQVNIRASRGQDILAACGQLAIKTGADPVQHCA
jgi:23S rRNA (adenine2503-C2)-methyltransferase